MNRSCCMRAPGWFLGAQQGPAPLQCRAVRPCDDAHLCCVPIHAGKPAEPTLVSPIGQPAKEAKGAEGGLRIAVQDPGRASHGLECVVEVLGFIVTLITTKDDDSHPGLSVFGLELMHAALQAGGTGPQTCYLCNHWQAAHVQSLCGVYILRRGGFDWAS